MIDQSFADVATWHPAVERLFITSHRTWRKGLLAAIKPISNLIRSARETRYDWVIDGQGNFKTALMSLFMRGPTAGFDRKSVREPIAAFAYQRRYPASRKAHAIDRLRRLFSASLGYPLPKTPPDFGIDRNRFAPLPFVLPKRYLVFIHSASWKTKLWPETSWKALILWAIEQDYSVLLPWGSIEEKARAERLAVDPRTLVLPKLSLSQIGTLLSHASACVSMDTGLSHLAAALQIPSVTLYGATDSGLIGSTGTNQLHLQSTLPCAPCSRKTCQLAPDSSTPPCLAQLTPEVVSQKLSQILKTPTGNRLWQ
jgi:heptosyltransferase-1